MFKAANRLVEHGASVNEKTDYGLTALHLASQFGHYDVFMLLLRHHALSTECPSFVFNGAFFVDTSFLSLAALAYGFNPHDISDAQLKRLTSDMQDMHRAVREMCSLQVHISI